MSSAINMYDELFIDPSKVDKEYWIPPKSKEHYINVLNSKAGSKKIKEALATVIECFRMEASIRSRGKLEPPQCDELIRIILECGKKHSELLDELGALFLREGGRSEGFMDYESALKFYEKSLAFDIEDPKYRYFRLNNFGFCLNFLQRFESAEEFLRAATGMAPERYNAWKNLGVSLEHQGKCEEAAECYLKSIQCSGGEPRSFGHYRRLLERYPALAWKYPEIQNEE